tara:strand:- start:894 stop:2288 length:1395 start_codon:yes stop_codon:yes gene_type:complete
MIIWNSKILAKVLKSETSKSQIINNISINSKIIKKNCLFIPIKGKRFDGHDYIQEAFNNGAKLSLVQKKSLSSVKLPSSLKKKLIIVEDTIISMETIAREARNRAKKAVIIGITGSSGKTTLKNWTGEILEKFFTIHKTIGNFNNQIGLTLSLSMMAESSKFGIFELGMNQKGEIRKLTKIVKPDISIITNIAPAHIANFNSEIEIAEEKSCIFCENAEGIVILPRDSKYFKLLKMKAKKKSHKIYTFGTSKKSDFQFLGLVKKKEYSLVKFKILNEDFFIKNINLAEHLYLNICIIIGMAKILKINLSKLKEYLPLLSPIHGRGSIHKIIYKAKKITLIDDSYNSNPLSLEFSIKNLQTFNNYNRKICVIGDMLELGEQSSKFHLNVVKILCSERVDIVYTIGNFSKIISKNMPEKVICEHFENLKSLEKEIFSKIQNNDLILIKGSNSLGLSKICKNLMENE